MNIYVSYKDIEDGNTAPDACPITIALRRQLNNKNISVSRNYIRIPKKRAKDTWTLIQLPLVARNFLLNYYRYHAPQPFNFELSQKNVKALKG